MHVVCKLHSKRPASAPPWPGPIISAAPQHAPTRADNRAAGGRRLAGHAPAPQLRADIAWRHTQEEASTVGAAAAPPRATASPHCAPAQRPRSGMAACTAVTAASPAASLRCQEQSSTYVLCAAQHSAASLTARTVARRVRNAHAATVARDCVALAYLHAGVPSKATQASPACESAALNAPASWRVREPHGTSCGAAHGDNGTQMTQVAPLKASLALQTVHAA